MSFAAHRELSCPIIQIEKGALQVPDAKSPGLDVQNALAHTHKLNIQRNQKNVNRSVPEDKGPTASEKTGDGSVSSAVLL